MLLTILQNCFFSGGFDVTMDGLTFINEWCQDVLLLTFVDIFPCTFDLFVGGEEVD